MKKPRLQQRGERRIAAALRIALAAALLAVQVLFVVLTTRYLKDHFALIYGALEAIALITALYIYNKPGDLSYRVAWIIPILFVPVVGLILYLLWGGDTQRKRLQRQTVPKLPPEEPESLRNRSALNADRLQRALPGWSRVSQYLSSRGFYLYQNTKMVYLPEGALLLEDILGAGEDFAGFLIDLELLHQQSNLRVDLIQVHLLSPTGKPRESPPRRRSCRG